jgi:hypothetical protein
VTLQKIIIHELHKFPHHWRSLELTERIGWSYPPGVTEPIAMKKKIAVSMHR